MNWDKWGTTKKKHVCVSAENSYESKVKVLMFFNSATLILLGRRLLFFRRPRGGRKKALCKTCLNMAGLQRDIYEPEWKSSV